MITRIRGKLVSLSETQAILEVGAFDYEVYIPQFVQRQLQELRGEEISLQTIEYIEGNPQKGKLTPRLIGFMSDAERQFFDTICSVDGLGVKKALKAIVRPVREVAVAIEEQNVKELSTLPGIGPSMAERIVAKLRKKMTRFALMISKELPDGSTSGQEITTEAYEALIGLGHSPSDARQRIETVVESGKKPKTVEAMLTEIYKQEFQ